MKYLKKYRIARNTSIMLFTQITMQLANVVYVALLARHVGAEGIGLISTATALNALTILLVGTGMGTLFIRDISMYPEKAGSYLTNMMLMRAALLLPYVLLTYLVASLSDYSAEAMTILTLYIIVFSSDLLGELFIAVFRAWERIEFDAGTQILMTTLNVTISIFGISQGWDLIEIVWVTVFAHGVRFFVMLYFVLRYFVQRGFGIDLRLGWTLLLQSITFSLFLIIQTFQNKMGILILSANFNSAIVGLYAAANTIIEMLLFIPSAIGLAFLPNISRLSVRAPEAMRQFYSIAFRYLALIGFPLGVGTILLGGDLVEMIYGPDFVESRPVIRIMGVFLLLIVGYSNGPLLMATGRQRFFAWTQAIAAAISVGLNLLLVPSMGPMGAAIAFTSAGLTTFFIHSLACHRQLSLPLPISYLGRVALAAILMGVVIELLTGIGIHWLIVALTAAPIVYFGAAFLFKTIRLDEIKILAAGSPIPDTSTDDTTTDN